MKVDCIKIVEIHKLTEDNPTLCFSALRMFEKCHRCPIFQQKLKKHASEGKSINEMIELTISEMKCKPKLKKELIELLKKKTELLQEIADVQRRINEL